MAEFSIDIDRIMGTIGYSPAATLDIGSLGVIVVKQTSEYISPANVTNAEKFSSQINTGQGQGVGQAFIPGGQLQNGSKWLVFYSGTFGATTGGADVGYLVPRAFILDNQLVAERQWGVGCAAGPYPFSSTISPTINSARNGQCSGFFYYTANGTTLEFGFQVRNPDSVTGHQCYFRDFEITAIPLDQVGMVFTATDLFYKSIGTDYGVSPTGIPFADAPPNVAVSYEDVQDSVTHLPVTLGFTSATGDYLLLASGAAGMSGSQSVPLEYRFTQDAHTIGFGSFWKKQTKDNRDLIPYNAMYIKQYSNGQAVSLEIQGKPGTAAIPRFLYHPRIMALRLSAFARKAYWRDNGTTGSSPITSVYGNWQTVREVDFTPLDGTGEYVLALARIMAWRTDAGAVMARIIVTKPDGTLVTILKDWVSTTNVLGTDYDRADIFLHGCHLSNTPYKYVLQVCQAEGTAGTAFYQDFTFAVIGLTHATGTVNSYSVGVDDISTSNSSSLVGSTGGSGTTAPGVTIDDATGTATSLVTPSLVVVPTGVPALVRPRLWFYNNDRLAYLRTRTGGAEYALMLASMGQEFYSMAIKYVLKWKVTSDPADLAIARDKYFGATGLFSKDIVALLWGGDPSDSGFMYRFIMRDLSIALDWFYDDSGVDVMTVANGFPSNARAMIRNAILAMTYAKTQTRTAAVAMEPDLGKQPSYLDWANTDTHNNHFYDMMMGATYAGATLFGEAPTTFKYKASTYDQQTGARLTGPFAANTWLASGATLNFVIPYHIYSGNPGNYSDIWQWVRDRTDTMILPNLDVDSAGGCTEEGTRYGLVSAGYMTEQFALMKTCAGLNYVDTHPVFGDHGYFQMYATQPGAFNQVNLGDHPEGDPGRSLIMDQSRLTALHVADAVPSQPVADYLQYWINHKAGPMDEGNYEGMAFLLYRHDRPEANISGLPLHYVAQGTGFWNSRDSFADTGVSVSMSACSHGEEHHHSDFGALQIYRGDSPNPNDNGWLTIDINLKSTKGNNWDLVAHSADTFCTSVFPNGWAQQYFGTPPLVPPPPDQSPPPPILSSPADGAIDVVLPATLAWLASTGASSYWVEVSIDLAFTTLAYDFSGITTLTTSVSGLANSTVYYWRVRGYNATYGLGNWSNVSSFTTEAGIITPPPPQGVKLVEDTTALQIFPTNNWWNMDVSAWPVDVNSAAIIGVLNAAPGAGGSGFNGTFWPDFTSVAGTFGIPYIGVDATQPLVPVTLGSYADESDKGQPGQPLGFPIPNEAKNSGSGVKAGWREENGDNHMIVFDRQRNYLYELYHINWTGSQWTADQASCFQMNTNARRPDGWTSADAAGLAIFPGLVKYDDLHGSGPIRHATRFACKSANGYIYPGSHAGSVSTTPNHHVAGWLPFGGRIRLKASFDITAFVNGFGSLSAANKTGMTKLLQSWKTYGLIFADTGTNGMVQGTMDARWVNGEFNTVFKNIHFSSFDVLELGKVGP
jgi:hypothetical protein